MLNEYSLDTVCASLTYAMGIDAPEFAAAPNPTLTEYIDKKLNGKKADRVFMYNPDAVAQWVYEKHSDMLIQATYMTDLELPLCTVMPSVTPVCFATMYTGAQPDVHKLKRYEKPKIEIDSIFDALVRAGKKVALVLEKDCAIAKLFAERDIDYFIYTNIEEVNAKAAELIIADEHDFIVVYNGNYDYAMHKTGPESATSLAELKSNGRIFGLFNSLIHSQWKKHNTVVGFAMDHGCHDIDGECGAHGLDMDEDLNIVHFYTAHPAKE